MPVSEEDLITEEEPSNEIPPGEEEAEVPEGMGMSFDPDEEEN